MPNILKLKCLCPNTKTDANVQGQNHGGGCSYSAGKSVNMQNSDRKPCSIIQAKYAFRRH